MKVIIDDDFDLDKIINCGQCFRPARISADTYRFVTRDHVVLITDESRRGSKDEGSSICLTDEEDHGAEISVSCSSREWEDIWYPYFDLDTNYRDIRKSIPDDDAYLKGAARAGAGIRILRQDRFETLISFIISQRKSIPAIRTSIERLEGLFGKDGFFPEPEQILAATDEQLASCALGYRVPYVRAAAERVAHKDIDLEALDDLSDEELFDELRTFYGVGDKVANCVALFAYHRTGRAPVDTWIARVIKEQYGGREPFSRYKNAAGIMQQYMFYEAQHRSSGAASS